MNYYVKFLGRLGINGFKLNECLAPIAIEKIKILEAVLELPAKQHCQFSLFGSKAAPRIYIFLIAMGADYLFEMKNIEIDRSAHIFQA